MSTPGTINNPLPAHTNVVEPKVKWGAVAAYVVSFLLLGGVTLFTENENELLLYVLPDAVELFVLPFVPALASLAAGFAAKHQWRAGETRRVNPGDRFAD